MRTHIVGLILVAMLSMSLGACAATDDARMATPMPTEAPARVKTLPARTVESQALSDLAARLGVAEEDIVVESTTEIELPSGDLGCPDTTVATPEKTQPGVVMGQELTLAVDGKQYTYHGYNLRVAFCGEVNSAETISGQPLGVELEAIMENLDAQGRDTLTQARDELAGELGVAVDEINVVQAESMQWSDSSLGCPEPGMMYLQAITPGYRVILEHDGEQYDYHADERGNLKLCEPAE